VRLFNVWLRFLGSLIFSTSANTTCLYQLLQKPQTFDVAVTKDLLSGVLSNSGIANSSALLFPYVLFWEYHISKMECTSASIINGAVLKILKSGFDLRYVTGLIQ